MPGPANPYFEYDVTENRYKVIGHKGNIVRTDDRTYWVVNQARASCA